MKKIFFTTIMFVLLVSVASMAYETTKPETHNTSWQQLHGKEANISDETCVSCHADRVSCIACHEDVKPLNHNKSWVKKSHGIEARFSSQSCKTCHTEDSCISCHETAVPTSHNRAGFGTANKPGFHCYTGCQLPGGSWKNTMSTNCIICHTSRPITKAGNLHDIGQ